MENIYLWEKIISFGKLNVFRKQFLEKHFLEKPLEKKFIYLSKKNFEEIEFFC